jgi:excisionase family DNA binding protein
MPSIENLVRELQALGDVSPTDIPTPLGELERVRTTLWLRMLNVTNNPGQMTPAPATDLMTVAEVARTLRFSRGHIYELVRSGDLAAVRDGRHVRIPVESLRDWERRHQSRPLDLALSVSLSSDHDGRGSETHPQGLGAHAAPVRGARGRPRGNRSEVGDGRPRDSRASREAHATTGRHAGGQAKPSKAPHTADVDQT